MLQCTEISASVGKHDLRGKMQVKCAKSAPSKRRFYHAVRRTKVKCGGPSLAQNVSTVCSEVKRMITGNKTRAVNSETISCVTHAGQSHSC